LGTIYVINIAVQIENGLAESCRIRAFASDDVGLRKLDARIARPAPQRHVRDAAVLFLDDGRGDKILVIGKSRKKVEIVHVSVLVEDAHEMDRDV
jgi:hypothetical protein